MRIRRLFDAAGENGGGGQGDGAGAGSAGDGAGAGGEGGAKGGDKSELVREKIALRERARKAEAALTELQGKHEQVLTQVDELSGKVKDFEFKAARGAKLEELLKGLPDGQGVAPDKLAHLHTAVGKLTKAETLEQDIKDLLPGFVGKVEKPVVDSKLLNGQAGAPGGDVDISKLSPWERMQLQKSNPAAYAAAVAAEQAAARMKS